MRYVKNMDEKYKVSRCGRLFRWTFKGWKEMWPQANGQVELYRKGGYVKPLLQTLVNEAFDINPGPPSDIYDCELIRKLEWLYKKRKEPEIKEFMARMRLELVRSPPEGPENESQES